MKKLSSLALWIGVIVVASFMLYRVKYEVQSIKTQIEETSREMAQEREMLHVEAAEWAYINRSENLKKLADKYLGGKSVTVDLVAEVEAIAFRKQYLAAADMGAIADIGDVDMSKNNNSIAVSYRGNSAQR